MKHKYLDRPLEIKSIDDAGKIIGYASIFDEIDSTRDIVKSGAFKRTLAAHKKMNRKIPMLWQHDSWKPLGVYDVLEEDAKGLYFEGQLNLDVQLARESQSLARQGALTGVSIGYQTVKSKMDNARNVRELHEVDLSEISLVTFPSCDSARVLEVRSRVFEGELPTLPEFEDYLCEAGFSRTQAKAIASGGLSKLLQCEAASKSDANRISQALQLLTKG